MATKDKNPEDYPPGAGGHWEEDAATGDRRWVYDDPAQDPTPKGTGETPAEASKEESK